jgi:hypothetical protein
MAAGCIGTGLIDTARVSVLLFPQTLWAAIVITPPELPAMAVIEFVEEEPFQ